MEEKDYIFFDVRDYHKFVKQRKYQYRKVKPNFNLETEDGKVIYGRKLSFLGRGEKSTVWKYECDGKEYAIKIFFDTEFGCALNEDVYKIIKPLPLEKTLKALNTLIVVNSNDNGEVKYNAYIMEFLEEIKNYSIVEMPTPKLLENVRMLESDAELLAKNKIWMYDVKRKNTIFNKRDFSLYVSDIDMFSLEENKYMIKQNNYIALQNAIYRFLLDYSEKKYESKYNGLIYDYFYSACAYNRTISDKLEELFSPYDTPKQFFKDNKNYYYKKYF